MIIKRYAFSQTLFNTQHLNRNIDLLCARSTAATLQVILDVREPHEAEQKEEHQRVGSAVDDISGFWAVESPAVMYEVNKL